MMVLILELGNIIGPTGANDMSPSFDMFMAKEGVVKDWEKKAFTPTILTSWPTFNDQANFDAVDRNYLQRRQLSSHSRIELLVFTIVCHPWTYGFVQSSLIIASTETGSRFIELSLG